MRLIDSNEDYSDTISTLHDVGCFFDENLEETVVNTEVDLEEMEYG